MILQALHQYFQRKQSSEENALPRGYQKKSLSFVIVLDEQGQFCGFRDCRELLGKKKAGRVFLVPREVKRSSGIKANLLWDNLEYVLGYDMKQSGKSADKHAEFIATIRRFFERPGIDMGIDAVLAFLERGDFAMLFADALWPEIVKDNGFISFHLAQDRGLTLVSDRDRVRARIEEKAQVDPGEGEKVRCLVTGNMDYPVNLHTAIKGVYGAQSSGGNIVSFNCAAFESYEKTQGGNAPVGKEAEYGYTTALNNLLGRDSTQRVQVGDASTVFWAAQSHVMEGYFAQFFNDSGGDESEQDNELIKALYTAPHTGKEPVMEEDMTPFYILGLSPNAARIAIRFWYEGTVGETVRHIKQHFADCRVAHGPREPGYLSIFRLLVSTASLGKSENINPNLAGAMARAIFLGLPYPRSLLSAVLSRVKAEQANDKWPNVSYARVSLIKAVLVREKRFYGKNIKEVDMSLDKTNDNPGYLLGRLFAVLEKIQEDANPGLNATIRDRFYGAASATPAAVFPRLLKLKNHHLAKMEQASWVTAHEKRVGEIMEKLEKFPNHLGLDDQGRFAVGYYHQRNDFYKSKEARERENEQENN